MSQTIQGAYKNGVVSLDCLPEGVTEARVKVDFSEDLAPKLFNRARGIAYFGMFAPADGQFTSDESIEEVKKSLNPKLDE